jgi:hypothetical protein
MKTSHLPTLIAVALAGALTITNAHAQKFKADVPKSILTPDSVETRIGTLKFTDGLPDQATRPASRGGCVTGFKLHAFGSDLDNGVAQTRIGRLRATTTEEKS